MIEEGGIIEYFEVNDGEHLQVQQLDYDGEIIDRILMTRSVALELANKINELFGEV